MAIGIYYNFQSHVLKLTLSAIDKNISLKDTSNKQLISVIMYATNTVVFWYRLSYVIYL